MNIRAFVSTLAYSRTPPGVVRQAIRLTMKSVAVLPELISFGRQMLAAFLCFFTTDNSGGSISRTTSASFAGGEFSGTTIAFTSDQLDQRVALAALHPVALVAQGPAATHPTSLRRRLASCIARESSQLHANTSTIDLGPSTPSFDQSGFHRASSAVSLEEDLSHHSFVFVLQQVTVKHRHPTNDWIGEIHNEVD
jgi:hypothetical protein